MKPSDVQKASLVSAMQALVPRDGSVQVLAGLTMHRVSHTNQPLHSIPRPAFCVIAQGRKRIQLGNNLFTYDPDHYLLASVDLPVASQIVEASVDHPYLSLRMEFDPAMVASVVAEAGSRVFARESATSGLTVATLDRDLRDAVVRIVTAASTPADAPFLIPLIQREIVYRLLVCEQGPRLQRLAVGAVAPRGITQAIDRLRKGYRNELRIEQMARELGMSVSGFHHQFKAVTAMSPLQFQKHIRLQEARRLMLVDGLDATQAALDVGYGNPSQFSREYKRQFGAPPRREVQQARLAVPHAPAEDL